MRIFLFTLITYASLFCSGQDTLTYTVRFSSDASKLIKTQLRSLDSLVSSLDGSVNSFVYDIQGHTDSIGDRAYNLQLSEKRCQSIKAFLLKKGVKENRISFEKYSFDKPLAENTTDEGRASNRRATLTIIFKLDSPDWQLKRQSFQFDAGMQIVFTTKNGCKIGIPANALQSSDLKPVTGEVELQVTEYNDPADFIASGIPMSYNASGRLFMYHSHEMLNIKVFKDSAPVYLKNDATISLNCKKVDSLYTSGFYKFNLEEQRWFEDEKTETIKTTVIEEEKKETKPGPVAKPDKPGVKTETVTPEIKEVPITTGTVEIKPEVAITTGTTEIKPEIKPPASEPDNYRADENKKNEQDTGYVTFRKKSKRLKVKKPPLAGGDSVSIAKLDTSSGGRKCCSSDKICPCLREHIRDGLVTSERDLATSFDTSWTKYFDQRYSDFSYSGTEKIPPGTHISNIKYYHVKIKVKKLFLRKKAKVQIKFNKEKNPELKYLKKIKWKMRFKDNSEDYDSFRKRKFSDIRIQYDPLKKVATVELKEQDKFCSIILKAKDPGHKLEEKMNDYTSVRARRKRRFDRVEHNKAIFAVNEFYTRYVCFRHYRSFFYTEESQAYHVKKWRQWFNDNRPAIHDGYVFLNNKIDSILEPYCKESKFLIRAAGIDRFLLIGLGIYNYDQLIAVEDVVQIESPIFLTKKGRRINVKESFLVLEGINGMVRIEQGSPLKLIEKQRNIVFIVDKANRRFKIIIEPNENIHTRGKSFIMKNITATTQTLEELRKELMGK